MAKGVNLDQRKGQITDIKGNIESKKGQLENLTEQKKALLEAGTEVQGTGLDDRVIQTVMDSINQSLQDVESKGSELSSEMNSDAQMLEEIREDTERDIESTEAERRSLEQKKSLLDRFGLGASLDQGLSELSTHSSELDSVKNEAIQAMQELSRVSSQLDGLWKDTSGQTHPEERIIDKEKKDSSFKKTLDRELKRTAAIAAIGAELISGSIGEIHKINDDITTGLNRPIRVSQSHYIESNKDQNELALDALENVDSVLDEIIDLKKKKKEQDEITSTAGKKIQII